MLGDGQRCRLVLIGCFLLSAPGQLWLRFCHQQCELITALNLKWFGYLERRYINPKLLLPLLFMCYYCYYHYYLQHITRIGVQLTSHCVYVHVSGQFSLFYRHFGFFFRYFCSRNKRLCWTLEPMQENRQLKKHTDYPDAVAGCV